MRRLFSVRGAHDEEPEERAAQPEPAAVAACTLVEAAEGTYLLRLSGDGGGDAEPRLVADDGAEEIALPDSYTRAADGRWKCAFALAAVEPRRMSHVVLGDDVLPVPALSLDLRRVETAEAVRELTHRCEVAELALERMRAALDEDRLNPKLVEAWSEASQLRVLLDEATDRHRAERDEAERRVATAEESAAELRADAARLLHELAATRDELEEARRPAAHAAGPSTIAPATREWSPLEQELLAEVQRAIAPSPAASLAC